MNHPAGTTENCDTDTVLSEATAGGTDIGFRVATGVGLLQE